METTNKQETMTNRRPQTKNRVSTPGTVHKAYEGLGAAMVAQLMIGFWFGIGAILAIKMMKSLDYCVEELTKRK